MDPASAQRHQRIETLFQRALERDLEEHERAAQFVLPDTARYAGEYE